MKQPLKDETGVTLVEILVVLALLGVVVSALGTMYFTGFKMLACGDTRTEIQDHARVGLDYMVRGLREARTIVSIDDTEVIFLDSSGQKIGFRLYDGALYRDFYPNRQATTPVASNPFAECIDTVKFSCSETGTIEIFIMTSKDGQTYHLRVRVKPRPEGGLWE